MRLLNFFWAQKFVSQNRFKDKSLKRLKAVTVSCEDPYWISSLPTLRCLFGSNMERYFQLLSQIKTFAVFMLLKF